MLRSRMFPTKENFKGRWGNECEFCCEVESDIHLVSWDHSVYLVPQELD